MIIFRTGRNYLSSSFHDISAQIAYSDPLELLVEIDDGQFHGIGVSNPTVEVRVVLVDINDNPPTFEDDTVSRTVREVSHLACLCECMPQLVSLCFRMLILTVLSMMLMPRTLMLVLMDRYHTSWKKSMGRDVSMSLAKAQLV